MVPNVPYRLAVLKGRFKRWLYCQRLPGILARPIQTERRLPLTWLAFSSEGDFPEQVASLRSLIRHAGQPERMLLVSDGSHSLSSRDGLVAGFPGLEFVDWREATAATLTPAIAAYARKSPLGKKLAVEHACSGFAPLAYADSDVLFFPGASELGRTLAEPGDHPRYLLDCWPSFDGRLLRDESEKLSPVNAGFFILRRPLCWQESLERFELLHGEIHHFSEQTLVHLAVRQAGGMPLPPDRHVLANDDQWLWSDRYAGPRLASRHYISSFRHKFWNQVTGD